MNFLMNNNASIEHLHWIPTKVFQFFGAGKPNNSGLHLLEKTEREVVIGDKFDTTLLLRLVINIPIESARDSTVTVTLPEPPNGAFLPEGMYNELGNPLDDFGNLAKPDSEGNLTVVVGFDSSRITDEVALLESGIIIKVTTSSEGLETGLVVDITPVVKLELPYNDKLRFENDIPRHVKNTAFFAVEVGEMLFNSDFSVDLLTENLSLRDENNTSDYGSPEYLKNLMSFWCERDGTFSVRGETNKDYGAGKGKRGLGVKLIPSPMQRLRSGFIDLGEGEVLDDGSFVFNLGHRKFFPCSYTMKLRDKSVNPDAKYLTYSKGGKKRVTISSPSVTGYGSEDTFKLQKRAVFLDSKGTGYSYVDSEMFSLPDIGNSVSVAGMNFHEAVFFHQKSVEFVLKKVKHHEPLNDNDEVLFKNTNYSYYNDSEALHIFRTEGVPKEEDMYFQFGDDSEYPVTIQNCNNYEFYVDCETESARFLGEYNLFTSPPQGTVIATYRVNYGEIKQYRYTGNNGVHDEHYISRFLESILDEEGNRMVATHPYWNSTESQMITTPFFNPKYNFKKSESHTLYDGLFVLEAASDDSIFRKSLLPDKAVHTIEFFITEKVIDKDTDYPSYINIPLNGVKTGTTDLVSLLFGVDTVIKSCSKARWSSWLRDYP